MTNDYNANIILSTIGTGLGISIIVLKLIKYIKNDGKLDKEEISDLLSDAKEIQKEIDSMEKEHKDEV